MLQQRINSILSAINQGHADQAERLSRLALEEFPMQSDVLLLLAITLTTQKRYDEARAVYEQLIAIEPNEPAYWNNLGTVFRELDHLPEAESAYRNALSLDAGNPYVWANLGLVAWKQGDPSATVNLMLQSHSIDSTLPEPRIYGGLAAYECGDDKLTAQLISDHYAWPYLGPSMEVDLATALMQLGRHAEAESRLRSNLKHPEAAGLAAIRLATLLERVNRLEEAEVFLKESENVQMHLQEWLIAKAMIAMRKKRSSESLLLYQQYFENIKNSVSESHKYFLFAKACDANDDVISAMRLLEQGHALQYDYLIKSAVDLSDKSRLLLTAASASIDVPPRNRWLNHRAPPVESSPIFVVGFPRSGTTLLEQMLDAHPGIRSMDEQPFIQDVEQELNLRGVSGNRLDDLSETDLKTLRDFYWHRVSSVVSLKTGERIVDKNPLNLLRLPVIYRLFPNSPIILMLRHPLDVILSNYMQSFRAPKLRIICSSLVTLAENYCYAMSACINTSRLLPLPLIELKYEQLVDNFELESRRIAGHAMLHDIHALSGFAEQARAKGFISTPSYSQVVEPLNKRAIGRWQRYREYLEPVIPLVKPIMDHWGYSSD